MEIKDLKKRLKAIREAKGLSQNEIARLMRKPQSVISRFETQTLEPNYSLIHEYCKALGEDLVSVLTYDAMDYKTVYYTVVYCKQCDKQIGYSNGELDVMCNLCNDQNKSYNASAMLSGRH
jgi:transcriptional regulator with XRE-family HTH domain